MNYGSIKLADIANGPGCRTSFFVSGCRNHCKGCFNEDTWDFDYGNPYTADTLRYLLDSLRGDYIDGISILGGEPMDRENQPSVLGIVMAVKEMGKTVWLYSGYTWEELTGPQGGLCASLILAHTDVLVDGRFVLEEKDISLRYRGSRNQRILDVQKSLAVNQPVLYVL